MIEAVSTEPERETSLTRPGPSGARFIKVVWSDRGLHLVEIHGLRKVSDVRKLAMHALRFALRRVHAGRPLETPEGATER